jgi:hypothetical protein
MITCFVTNWGVTILLGLLLTISEWLGRNPRFKENSILCFVMEFLVKIKRG